MNCQKELKRKLSACYERQLKQWLAFHPDPLGAMAEEIAAAKLVHSALADSIADDHAAFLLGLDDPLTAMANKWGEEYGRGLADADEFQHCIWCLRDELDSQSETAGAVYQLIGRARTEFESYTRTVLSLPAAEIFQRSAETAAKENLLSSLIHDSYDLEDSDLQPVMEQDQPLDALYQYLLTGRDDLSSEDSISRILEGYNDRVQRISSAELKMSEGVSMC